MTSSSYLELLRLKQVKLLKVIDLFESGVRERSEFVNKTLCWKNNVSFDHSEDAVLKLSFMGDVKLECPLNKLRDISCGKFLLCSAADCSFKCRRAMARPERIHDSDDKAFKCRDCEYATNWKRSFEEHQVKVHSRSTGCKKVFDCEFDGCNFRTTFNIRAVEHRRKHLKIKPFKCQHPNCGLSFASRYCLRKHKVVHSKKKRFKCTQKNCNFATKRAKLLKAVNLFESGVGKRSDFVKKHLCGSENVSFNHSKDTVLKLAFNIDVKLECFNKRVRKLNDLCNGKKFACSTSNCGFKHRFPSYVARHELIHHSDEKPFKCHDCNFTTNWKHSLKEHQVRTHSKSTGCKNVFVCEFDGCNHRTTVNNRAVEHRCRHLKIKPFKCQRPDCGLSFGRKGCLRKHEIVHVEKKRFRCLQKNCNFATKHRYSLRLHQAIHSSVRAFKCPHENCTYAAKQRCGLQNHLQTHLESKPYKCDFDACSFATKYKGSLQNHASCHKNSNQFKCNFKHCNFGANSRQGLRAHQIVHSEIKPFKCDYKNCSFAAIKKDHLIWHKMNHERNCAEK